MNWATDYYVVDVPSELTEDPDNRFDFAVEQAREDDPMYFMPCEWDPLSDDGDKVSLVRRRDWHDWMPVVYEWSDPDDEEEVVRYIRLGELSSRDRVPFMLWLRSFDPPRRFSIGSMRMLAMEEDYKAWKETQ